MPESPLTLFTLSGFYGTMKNNLIHSFIVGINERDPLRILYPNVT